VGAALSLAGAALVATAVYLTMSAAGIVVFLEGAAAMVAAVWIIDGAAKVLAVEINGATIIMVAAVWIIGAAGMETAVIVSWLAQSE